VTQNILCVNPGETGDIRTEDEDVLLHRTGVENLYDYTVVAASKFPGVRERVEAW
jgi:predicted phosphodiesterase